ncbi:unnamed protein product [Caenorhabditis nigoni]
MVHESIFESAHLGQEKTEERVRSIAVWKGMNKAIAQVIGMCEVCQKNKDTPKTRIRAPLGKFETPTSPFQRVHSDFIGPLPETEQGNNYIAVFVDAFSKFVIAEAVRDQKAETLCRIFTDRVVSRFGPPQLLITDRGTNFTSKKFQELLTSMNIAHRMSTAYHHEANGQVERVNQTIEQMLRQCEEGEDWDTKLQLLIHACNNAKHSTTGVTPYIVMHGQEAGSPMKSSLPKEQKDQSPEQYVEDLKKKKEQLHGQCVERIEKRSTQQKELHDEQKLINNPEIQKGDQVWIRRHQKSKIGPQFEGPYKVKNIDGPNIEVFINGPNTRRNPNRTRIAHKNRCKLHRTIPANDEELVDNNEEGHGSNGGEEEQH